MTPIERGKRQLRKAEAEFDFVGTIIGVNGPLNRFVYLLLALVTFLLGTFFTVTHVLHENSLVVRLWGPLMMVGSLLGLSMVFKKKRKGPPKLLSEDEMLYPDFGAIDSTRTQHGPATAAKAPRSDAKLVLDSRARLLHAQEANGGRTGASSGDQQSAVGAAG